MGIIKFIQVMKPRYIIFFLGLLILQSGFYGDPFNHSFQAKSIHDSFNWDNTALGTPTPGTVDSSGEDDDQCLFNELDCEEGSSSDTSKIDSDLSPPELADVVIILFWMQDCVHCEEVLNTVLPDIRVNYQDQISIYPVELKEIEEVDRFYQMAERLGVAKNDIGVPLMLIGEQVLTGNQIKSDLSGWIETYLQNGSASIPAIPEFADLLPESILNIQDKSNLDLSDDSSEIPTRSIFLIIGIPILLLTTILLIMIMRKSKKGIKY